MSDIRRIWMESQRTVDMLRDKYGESVKHGDTVITCKHIADWLGIDVERVSVCKDGKSFAVSADPTQPMTYRIAYEDSDA